MIKGTVKFFNNAKGFGFITPDDGSKDVFLPAATIVASGTKRLKAGQRVSFEQEPDVKGAKAVQLKLLDEMPVVVAVAPQPQPQSQPQPALQPQLRPQPQFQFQAQPNATITVYHDPSTDESDDVLNALDAAGREPRLVDYTATPPDREELKRLSFLLREADQNLVRRYDRLFLELQLDDRFIAENEFWTAIVEHPLLINGPVLMTAEKVRICKTADDVRSFLGLEGASEAGTRRKGLSARMAAMIGGHPVPPRPVQEIVEVEVPVKRAVAKVEPRPKAVEPKPEPAPEPEPKPEPKAKKVAAPARKAAKAPAKPLVAKPVKKAKAPVAKAVPAKKKKK
jgi:arsenate reductase (glutaredoxin)